MKRIFSLALAAMVVAAGGLACKKSDQSMLGSNSGNQPAQAAESGEKVLNDLTALIKQYFVAINRGDKGTLERLLAPEFNSRWRGKDYDKDAWVGPQAGEPNVAGDEIYNAQLAGSSADEATVHFERRTTYKDNSPPYKERNSATFVKKEGRWQIKTLIYGH
ncbi:MAG TPA: nuclear transport factor 2 family protein [Pyrinomonadaceae bacterium]|nr:nuclear transport factor 2 family protein [Pyrinomonadaceae bacterium]